MATLFLILLALGIIALVASHIYSGILREKREAEDARRTAGITGISVTLDVEEKHSLFILLAADGSINRLGTGTADNTENHLFIGKTKPAIFESVRSHVTPEMWDVMGRAFWDKNPLGPSCKLTILFHFKDGKSNGFEFRYGAESEGPPREVADFVRAAVSATDPWYEDFKQAAAAQKRS